MFLMRLFQAPEVYAPLAVILIFSICAHELVHAWVALTQGDDTAARAGHLTLNPLKQMGWLSLIMFAFFGIAWGQVPVDPARMRKRWSQPLTAAAGPLTNLGLFLIFVWLGSLVKAPLPGIILIYAGAMNLALCLLNLLPLPGLDGAVIGAWLFPRFRLANTEFAKGAYLVGIVLVFAFFSHVMQFVFMLACRLAQVFGFEAGI